MNKKLIKYIREEFEKLLADKTSFGRNQIKELHEKAISNAVVRLLDDKEN